MVIDTDDLNELKARGIAQDNFTTWLTLTSSTVRDMSVFMLPVLPLVSGVNAINVDIYTEDMTGPILLNFTLNLTSETPDLTFDELLMSIPSISLSLLYRTRQVNLYFLPTHSRMPTHLY